MTAVSELVRRCECGTVLSRFNALDICAECDRKTTPALADIAARIESEHAHAQKAMRVALEHAIACGEALIEGRDECEPGTFHSWLEAHTTLSVSQATSYIRIAYYRDLLSSDLSVSAAVQRLVGLPSVLRHDERDPTHEYLRNEVQSLHDAGRTRNEIARILGISVELVATKLLTPEEVDSKRDAQMERIRNRTKDAAERRLLQVAAEEDARMKSVGGGVYEAYHLVLKYCAGLDKLARNGADVSIRSAAEDALAHAYRSKDAILRAQASV